MTTEYTYMTLEEMLPLIGPERYQQIGPKRLLELLRIPSREMVLEAIHFGVDTGDGEPRQLESITIEDMASVADQVIAACFPDYQRSEMRMNAEFEAAYQDLVEGMIPMSERLTQHGLSFKRHMRSVWALCEATIMDKIADFDVSDYPEVCAHMRQDLLDYCEQTRTQSFPKVQVKPASTLLLPGGGN